MRPRSTDDEIRSHTETGIHIIPKARNSFRLLCGNCAADAVEGIAVNERITINNHVPRVRPSGDRNDADRCVSVHISLHKMRAADEAQER